MTLKPSHFCSAFPMGSIARSREVEIVASNIMLIRKRRGDEWKLSWRDYKAEREKDGGIDHGEQGHFATAMRLIPDAIGAIAFAPAWTSAARKASTKRS